MTEPDEDLIAWAEVYNVDEGAILTPVQAKHMMMTAVELSAVVLDNPPVVLYHEMPSIVREWARKEEFRAEMGSAIVRIANRLAHGYGAAVNCVAEQMGLLLILDQCRDSPPEYGTEADLDWDSVEESELDPDETPYIRNLFGEEKLPPNTDLLHPDNWFRALKIKQLEKDQELLAKTW